MCMRQKFGQATASGAAITLIVITVVVVLYVLFLPPAERLKLLEGENGNGEPSPSRPEVLLEEFVGRLQYVRGGDVNFDLQSFNLRTITSAQVVASKSNMYVKNSLFDTITDTFNFNVDTSRSEDLLLTFNARGKGHLEVKLNGERVFFGEIDGNSPPIYLNKNLLESSNTLFFEVSSPGIVFWSFNSYEITSARIIGDVTDTTRSMNQQTVSVSEMQLDLLSTARLRYFVSCNPNEVKEFEIKLNHNSIFKGIPDCSVLNHVSISRSDLYPGVNFFEFSLEEGMVTVDQLRLMIQLETPQTPLYYFDVEDRFFYENESLRASVDATLKLEFPNTDRKRLEVFINGRIISINIADFKVERDVSTYLRPGLNTLEIRPLQDIDIVEMRLELT